MTAHQTKKFLNSSEFDNACNLAYPFGYDEESDAIKINLVNGRRLELKAKWESIYFAATNGDWNTEENLSEFHRACSAQNNADDTAFIDKVCEADSAEYYRVALVSYETAEA